MTTENTTITLGTRGSKLARWQTEHVQALLEAAHPDLDVAVLVISTKGDRVLDTPLPLLGGKGLFTAELESALHNSAIDYAVHSLKDLPTDDPDGLVVGAIPERANPADAVISRKAYTVDTLPKGATVGTSSRRRAAQLLHLRPDLNIIDIRGNIDTRINKALDSDGPYDAIVLACAGLERLDMMHFVSEALSPQQMLPAPGQGALGVQCRDEPQSLQQLAPIHHLETALAVAAERAFLAELGGGCSVPVAAYAYKQESGTYQLTGRVCAVDGATMIEVEAQFTGDRIENALQAGRELAQQAIDKGADRLLEAVE